MMKKHVSQAIKHIVCILLSIIVIAPFYMVLVNSFKGKAEAARMTLSLPTQWHFETYIEVIDKANLIQGFWNSFTYAFVSTCIGVLTCSMIPFCVFTIKNFVSSIPLELDEAAVIDGCGPISLFFKVVFPLLKPTVATCFILQFMGIWSDFLTPLYLSNSSKLYPMTMAVYQFFGRNKNWWHYVFADIVLTCIPVIIVYMIGQKYIIGGMTSGGVKE